MSAPAGHACAPAARDALVERGALLDVGLAQPLDELDVLLPIEPSVRAEEAQQRARLLTAVNVDADVQRMESRLREALGTKVAIAPGRKGGRITITWYDDDLGRLVDTIASTNA